LKEFLLLLAGFILAHIPGVFDRKRKLKTHWHAIRAEMTLCKEKAETLLNTRILAPLYRLPVVAYSASFPILLAEGAVTEDEVMKIGRCFGQIQDINRGLDYAAEMYKLGNNEKLEKEHERNCLKAKALLFDEDGDESLFEPAKKIVDSKILVSWWRY
jgi:hypothetical protein